MSSVKKAYAVGVFHNEKAHQNSFLTVRTILSPSLHERRLRDDKNFDRLAKRNKRSFDALNEDPALRRRLLGKSYALDTPNVVHVALGAIIEVREPEKLSCPDSAVMKMMATLGPVRPIDLERELEKASDIKPNAERLPMSALRFGHLQRVVIGVTVEETPYALELEHHAAEGERIGSIQVIFMPAIFSE